MLSLSTPERSWSPPTVTSPCSTPRRAPRLEPGANFSIPGFLLSGCARYNQLWGQVDFCKGSIQRNFECFTKSDNDDLFSLQADEGVGLGRMDRVGRVTLFHLYWQTLKSFLFDQYRRSIRLAGIFPPWQNPTMVGKCQFTDNDKGGNVSVSNSQHS